MAKKTAGATLEPITETNRVQDEPDMDSAVIDAALAQQRTEVPEEPTSGQEPEDTAAQVKAALVDAYGEEAAEKLLASLRVGRNQQGPREKPEPVIRKSPEAIAAEEALAELDEALGQIVEGRTLDAETAPLVAGKARAILQGIVTKGTRTVRGNSGQGSPALHVDGVGRIARDGAPELWHSRHNPKMGEVDEAVLADLAVQLRANRQAWATWYREFKKSGKESPEAQELQAKWQAVKDGYLAACKEAGVPAGGF